MHNEITAAVLFLVQLIEKNEKFSPDQLKCFERRLVELLMERFKNHWFPDKPFKGQGYRCIRVNTHSRRDKTLESAARAAGVKYEDLSLPVELTLWVDPNEVCCRFGESKGSYCTLASFDDKENSIPILKFGRENGNTNKEAGMAEDSTKAQKSLMAPSITGDHHTNNSFSNVNSKSKPLSNTNQNQQHSASSLSLASSSTGRKRNLHSPARVSHSNKNRSWFNHSFGMGYGPHPMSQPWYNVMPPPFIGGPSPPPFMGPRGNKWSHPPHSSYPAPGPSRFHHWSPKAALKV
ncbi:protein BTG3-like [Athalia rosae]|uniref:protein BTG3-like n=1 Tax=Athalia rosae TaxID=37344 RepID=UPI000626009B|nr:protein BTG3-like [Athalia rosae]XP_012264851.1 protein BTG3-like [Athalia rosae]XP_048514893.1 protein BTG3-like [Athalia rosae]